MQLDPPPQTKTFNWIWLKWFSNLFNWVGGQNGTFTPTLQDGLFSDDEGQTYATQKGHYVKLGDTVSFWIKLQVNSLGTLTGSTYIGNLPYTANLDTSYSVTVGYAASLSITAGQVVCGYVGAGTNRIYLRLWDDAGGTTGLLISEYSAGGLIEIAGSYRINER